MFIQNGRVGADQNIGNFTWRNASVIGYCIADVDFTTFYISDFGVLPFTSSLSDLHNALSVELKCEKAIVTDICNDLNNDNPDVSTVLNICTCI